jgi:urea transport system permease protein
MVMLGAYTTGVVQEVIRAKQSGLFGYSLAPPSRLRSWSQAWSGSGRARHHPFPLRTAVGDPAGDLGTPLVLQQAVRTAFGSPTGRGRRPDERLVDLGQMTITYNHCGLSFSRW